MKLKERIKASLKHKHEWQEDQWGKRCQVCGFVKTKKFEKRNRQVQKTAYSICITVAFSLGIVGIILWLLAPPGQVLQEMRRFWYLGNRVQWGFFYLWLALWLLNFARHFIGESKEEKA